MKFNLTHTCFILNINKFFIDIEQLQVKVNELLHENKLLQTQYDERKIHIQYVSFPIFLHNLYHSDISNQNYINPIPT
jgi:hypothetical protein